MSLANPAALWLLGLAVPILALHVLRSRRTELVVSSVVGWEHHDRPVAAARPWQRLRWSLPLVLQLLLVALLATALAGPAWDTGRSSAQHLVVIVDTSASMGALDGDPDRLASARAEVLDAVDDLGSGARVSIVAAGAPATVAAGDVAPAEVRARLESLEVSQGPFDGEVASSLALSLDRPDRSTAYLLVTDGGLTGAEVSLLPPGTEARTVGRRSTNLGVGDVVVSAGGGLLHVQATVTNSGEQAMSTVVRVDVDGVSSGSAAVQVPARERVEVGLDVAEGERLVVHLDSDDLLPGDDRAHAVGPAARQVQVLRAGGADPFLDALLEGRDDLQVTHVAELAELGEQPYEGFDLAVLDGVAVTDTPPIPWWSIASAGGGPAVELLGEVQRPVAALARHDHELLAGLDLSELAIATAQQLRAPSATTLLGSEQTPLLVAGRDDGVPFLHLGFRLQDSNLGLLPAFPVLGDRVLTQLAGADLAGGQLTVGDTLPPEVGSSVVVVSPSGTRTEVPPGGLPPELDRTGFWKVVSEVSGERWVVVNPPPRESALAPVEGLAIPGVAGGIDGEGAPVRTSFVPWLLLAALVVLAGEWWAMSRRRGVGQRQWRLAQVARAALAVLVLVALVVPRFDRSSDEVATVFVLDVSDSVAGGRDRAVEAVRGALGSMPAGSAAGVVLVGAQGRIDVAVRESLVWAGPRVQVDGFATDLAAGVRIAGAIAPGDHARRVVLLSDGRPTTGALDAEVDRLRRAGVRLDVVPIESSSGPDVLVRSLEVADRARSTDALGVRVRLSATTAQRVSVALRRDDVEVDRRLVDVDAGESVVDFEQPPGEPGTIRWSATVAGPENGVPYNDHGRASTRVEGRPELLVVEGAPGEGDALATVLAATGAGVQVVAPEDLPALDGLGVLDAVALVDVPASALTTRQVDALTTATRELGTGLVTLGGTSSYGAGDYLGSALEQLLPVTSEAKDPERRSKVAQVFAVDVSGSMGACHCAEDGVGENSRLPGGVEKTDIAREAALLALQEIRPTDELGVLALDARHRWLLDLGPVGDGTEARRGLAGIDHDAEDLDGSTNLGPSLSASAQRLRGTDASLRHIVLFTDGFEDPAVLATLADEAARLRDENITVSVMGTGEGSAVELRAIADAGGGRFYPGRDLQQLPDLLLEETKVVARQLIVEGEFLPEVTSSAAVVDALVEAPAVRGYVATTPRPTATQHLRVGEEQDPLMASWQVGLGRVLSWTSDAGARWAGGWTSWADAPQFWAGVLRSVQREPAGTLEVRFDLAAATLRATFDRDVPDGAQVRAVVTAPDGNQSTVPMRRVDARTYEGTASAGPMGTYGVGVTASVGDEVVAAVTGTAEQGYSREYSGEAADPEYLEAVSLRAEGRGSIDASQAFDAAGLVPGRRSVDLRTWALLAAALLWPLAVASSRLRRAPGRDAVVRRERLGRVGVLSESLGRRRTEREQAAPPAMPASPPTATPSSGPHTSPMTPRSADHGTRTPAPGSESEPTPGADPAVESGPGSTLESLLEERRRRKG